MTHPKLILVMLAHCICFGACQSGYLRSNKVEIKVQADYAELVKNLVTMDNNELHLIMDTEEHRKTEMLKNLQKMEIPLHLHSVKGLNERVESHVLTEKCPIFYPPMEGVEMVTRPKKGNLTTVAEKYPHNFARHSLDEVCQFQEPELVDNDGIYIREPFLKQGRYLRTIVVWVDQVSSVLTLFHQTALYCFQRVDAGIYRSEDRFFFIVDNNEERNKVLLDPYMRKHAHVAAIQYHQGTRNMFQIFTFNFNINPEKLKNLEDAIVKQYLWTPNNPLKSVMQAFTKQDNFNMFEFRIGTLPYAHHVLADRATGSEVGPNKVYTNYWGYEFKILHSLAEKLNFTYKIYNVEDEVWGHTEPNGKWSGMVEQAGFNDVDFIMSAMYIIYHRIQMIDGTITFHKDFQMFVSPLPSTLPKSLAAIRPMAWNSWIAILISCLICATAFWLIASVEEKIVPDSNLMYWHSLQKTLFYIFPSLVCQSTIIDDPALIQRTHAVRSMLAFWMFHCFILSAAYSGNLVSFLTTPGYNEPIDTLEQLAYSDIPIQMYIYDEEEEKLMAESTDPVLMKIWNEKTVRPYSPKLNLDDVVSGEIAFIDWKSGFDSAIYSKYSNPKGEPLVHKSSLPNFMSNYNGLGFHKFNPWRLRFNRIIRRQLEAGLVDHWIEKTFVEMKKKNFEIGDVVEIIEPDLIAPIKLEDVQSGFYVLMIFVSFSFIVFQVELIVYKCEGHDKKSAKTQSKKKKSNETTTADVEENRSE